MAAKNVNAKKVEEIEEHAVQMFLGETVLVKANVMRYNSMSSRGCGAVGTLFITNFKVAFTCSSSYEVNDFKKANSVASLEKLLAEERSDIVDLIPLTSIHQCFAISTLKQKRKKIKNTEKEISQHYDVIEIETKDFRVIQYDFRFAKQQERRSCFQMISHYVFPATSARLFAFDYGRNVWKSSTDNAGRAFSTFRHKKDYEMNLSRLRSSENWRVSSLNSKFTLSTSLPEYNVCPATLEDKDVENIAEKYCDGRFPLWLWSDPNTGAALLLSSELKERDGTVKHPSKLLNCISESVSQGALKKKTSSVDISSACPTLKQVKQHSNKLRKACIVRSPKEFWTSDSSWLSAVEETGWLRCVCGCLNQSILIVKMLKADDYTSVIAYESDGRNFSLLITSLAQIMLDPHYRTHLGLQALIQKDWVMKGHPFSKRLGNLYQAKHKDKEGPYDGESPVFLLFLDCVHQLLRQFPHKFEYTEQFLILLVDCSYSALFETFLFDCDSESQSATSGKSELVSAWDFIATNIPQSKFTSVLTNPAYKFDDSEIQYPDDHRSCSSANSSDGLAGVDIIIPVTLMTHLHVWYNYFFRWFPCTDAHKGCSTEVMLQLQQKQLMDEVLYLQDRMLQLQHMSTMPLVGSHVSVGHSRTPSNLSTDSNPSNRSLGRRKKHKRNASKYSNNEEVKDDFLSLMSGFYFLKML